MSVLLTFSVSRLRERRTAVMGVAAMIYFAHAYAYVDLGAFGTLFSFGNWGVDVFLLLSGFGMCYSMSKRPLVGDFYWKRFVRVGIPYLVLAGPFCFVTDVIVANPSDWGMFALDVSTLSYWLCHRGAWYVAMLVPLYLSVPLVGWLGRRFGILPTCVVATVLSAVVALGLKAGFTDAGLALNVANVVQRLPSFFVGYLLADCLMTGKSRGISAKVAVLLSAIVLAGWFLLRNTGCMSFLPALVIAFWASAPARLPFDRFFTVLGEASLESYLLNIYVLALMRDAFGWSGPVEYLVVTAVAIAGALLVHRVLGAPLKRLAARRPMARQVERSE